MSDNGGSRRDDPKTSKDAAKSIMTARVRLGVLRTLYKSRTPLNGWELSVLMHSPTITVVPRLCGLRRAHLIIQQGTRAGPSGRQQIAYVLTAAARAALEKPDPAPVAPAALESVK